MPTGENVNECLQHCSNIWRLCCARNCRCESCHVTSPLVNRTTPLHAHHAFLVHFFAVVVRLRREAERFKGDVTRGNSQRRFLAQCNVATLLGYCFDWLQYCFNIATPCCTKNRRCELSQRRSATTILSATQRRSVGTMLQPFETMSQQCCNAVLR